MDRYVELIVSLALVAATAALLPRWFEWRRALVNRWFEREEVGHV